MMVMNMNNDRYDTGRGVAPNLVQWNNSMTDREQTENQERPIRVLVVDDEPLIIENFVDLPQPIPVNTLIDRIRANIPLFSALTRLQVRELLLQSKVHFKRPGDTVFQVNDYTNSLYAVIDGTVTRAWAWTHHPAWYRELTGRNPREDSERERAGGAEPREQP